MIGVASGSCGNSALVSRVGFDEVTSWVDSRVVALRLPDQVTRVRVQDVNRDGKGDLLLTGPGGVTVLLGPDLTRSLDGGAVGEVFDAAALELDGDPGAELLLATADGLRVADVDGAIRPRAAVVAGGILQTPGHRRRGWRRDR